MRPYYDLRQAISTDLSQIIALDQEVFGAYGAAEDPAIIQARLTVFPAGCVILEELNEDGVPAFVGYLTTEKWEELRDPVLDEDPRTTHDPNGAILCITTLAVAPAYQNQRLGERLLGEAIRIARNARCTQIVLETAHAQRFYLRHGFTILKERKQRDIPLTVMQLRF